jgi:hypothetical protein
MSELQRPAMTSQRLVRIVKRICRILVAGAGDCVTGSEDHAYRELIDCFATRGIADLPYHLLDWVPFQRLSSMQAIRCSVTTVAATGTRA